MRLAGSLSAIAALAATLAVNQAVSQNGLGDNEAGVPLNPRDAAQVWTLERQGRALCRVRLEASPVGRGDFGIQIPQECGASLPTGTAAWRPVNDGAALVDADGRVLLHFDRWSNSLLVATRGSGVDLALRRGV
jgi:hypothetical protein